MATTVIQKDLIIQGDLVAKEGAISIAGNVTGNVDAKFVEILATGTVKGGVHAAEVKVAGGVEGSIECRALAIEEKGELKADVTAGTMTMSSGAKISGRVEASGS